MDTVLYIAVGMAKDLVLAFAAIAIAKLLGWIK